VEPIPETTEAIEEFGPFGQQVDLLAQLIEMGSQVAEIVPECIGLSLAYREHGVTFTLVASDERIAALDGLQYLDGGPCVAAIGDEAEVVEFSSDDPLSEEKWQLFARGTSSTGIASTLTIPIMVGAAAIGSVNLYAATPHAFSGKHSRVADVLGAWAPGAVENADLTFETRRTAQQAPRLLAEETRLQVAVGILVRSLNISITVARERLHEAALRAGVTECKMADYVIALATPSERRTDDA
jgi:transcriptional regulator with GAF, ATPase, and Fis domain